MIRETAPAVSERAAAKVGGGKASPTPLASRASGTAKRHASNGAERTFGPTESGTPDDPHKARTCRTIAAHHGRRPKRIPQLIPDMIPRMHRRTGPQPEQ